MTMPAVQVDVEYLSVGANRQTAAGDWSADGTVAFGADTNVALWRPNVRLHFIHAQRYSNIFVFHKNSTNQLIPRTPRQEAYGVY